jgi:pilus assembly protein CpaE
MHVYLFTAGIESDELLELERRISVKVPHVQRLARIDEVSQRLAGNGAASNSEQIYIIFPVLAPGTSLERIVSIAERPSIGVFLIFVSREISASDYKRLVRSGSADWVSLQNAPQEILDIISRSGRKNFGRADAQPSRPSIAAFVPSSGGVGNATLAIESAVQIRSHKQLQDKRICLLDLDVQTSHVCDYLDIEPRLQISEIVDDPGRLDAQLFDLFVSHHSASGLDVLAVPRGRHAPDLTIEALDALFGRISERYNLVIIDLPSGWSAWTEQIIGVCDLAVITGLNNVPSLRQVSEMLASVRGAPQIPPRIVVALNRCERRLVGGIARRQHVQRVLGREQVFYVREDAFSANHSLNTGVPISLGAPSTRIAKDIRPLVSLIADLKPGGEQVSGIAPAGSRKMLTSGR